MINRNILIILIFILLIFFNINLFATGIGAYLNSGIGNTNLAPEGLRDYYDYRYNVKGLNYFYGAGFIVDSNFTTNKFLNLRFKLGCDEHLYPQPYRYRNMLHQNYREQYSIRVNLNSICGMRIFHNNYIRIWIGPQLTINYEFIPQTVVFDVGPVFGINFHLTDLFSLSPEIGLHGRVLTLHSKIDYNWRSYNVYGAISFLLRINETYENIMK
jgi:hypothetical protein